MINIWFNFATQIFTILHAQMIIFITLVFAIIIAFFLIMRQPQFGKKPSGKRLQRILQSPNYQNGAFQNRSPTPQLAENTNMTKVVLRFLFGNIDRKIPKQKFNFEKTNLKSINPDENVFIWFGHSSYFIQVDGKKILVDPIFSGHASPFSFTGKSMPGTDIYSAEDMPQLDYLIITHDHWDHLDYETVKKLNPKVDKVITGLGTGEHLEYWNYEPAKIIELDWEENFDLGNGFKIYCETSRHFSGRSLKRDQSIWASFALITPTHKIYIGGDSGYDSHFKKIGEKFGGFDLAILETGQYNQDWKYIHMIPAEQLQAMNDLMAKRMIPVHHSKFVLATHPWDEPLKKITEKNIENLRILTPKIGEKTYWEDDSKTYEKWWEAYD